VVSAIRNAILANELVPGQRLVEAELCKLLGCTHGTVRLALMDLAHEGLVERAHNFGARVRVVGLQEALHISEARLILESVCVTRAAEKITDEEIRELRRLAKVLKERADEGDVAGFAECTHAIVMTYARIADQPVIYDMLISLRVRSSHHRFRLINRSFRAKIVTSLWLKIVDGICKRDPAAARRALQRYASNVQEEMRELSQEHKPFATAAPHPEAAEQLLESQSRLRRRV
jgi:DNA-binding GntR family transcriptional regulator